LPQEQTDWWRTPVEKYAINRSSSSNCDLLLEYAHSKLTEHKQAKLGIGMTTCDWIMFKRFFIASRMELSCSKPASISFCTTFSKESVF